MLPISYFQWLTPQQRCEKWAKMLIFLLYDPKSKSRELNKKFKIRTFHVPSTLAVTSQPPLQPLPRFDTNPLRRHRL